MLKNKKAIGVVIGLVLTLIVIFLIGKLYSDIRGLQQEKEEIESFNRLVDSVKKLGPGERNYGFARLVNEGAAVIGFSKGFQPIDYKNPVQSGKVIRPAACTGAACLCFCRYLEPMQEDWKEYDRDNPVDVACLNSICKTIDADIADSYNQDNFRIPGVEEDFEFKNGFVLAKWTEKKRKIQLGKYDIVHKTPVNPSATKSPFGVDLHFEREKDTIHFCFEPKCIT